MNLRYTCEFNITQYGEDSKTDLANYTDQKRSESVKDILNLGLVAHLESITPPNLPSSPDAAKKFQKENLTATVNMFLNMLLFIYIDIRRNKLRTK